VKQRGILKLREGVVLSDRMAKTVVVGVDRLVQHPQYKKYVRVRKKFKAHDQKDSCRVGDRVLIRECRPLSKEKRWKVTKILARAKRFDEAQHDSGANDS
jgi:small subunit ribosomal protein S17